MHTETVTEPAAQASSRPAELNEEQRAARRILAGLCTSGLADEELRGEMLIGQHLGIGSLKLIRLFLEVEAKAGRKIFNVANIAAIKTVGDLDAVLAAPPAEA